MQVAARWNKGLRDLKASVDASRQEGNKHHPADDAADTEGTATHRAADRRKKKKAAEAKRPAAAPAAAKRAPDAQTGA